MKTTITLITTALILATGWIVYTASSQVEVEAYPYCRQCHVCERRLCTEDINELTQEESK